MSVMRRIILLTIVFITVSGCTTMYNYRKDGTEKHEFKRDMHACNQDAQASGVYEYGPLNIAGNNRRTEYVRECMEVRGWEAVQR